MSLASTTDALDPTPPDPVTSAPKAVTALFDTRDHAERARADLIHAGVPPEDVSIVGSEALSPQDAAAEEPEEPHGFWHQLKHLFMPEEDRAAYAEGLRRGGYTVAVRTDAAAFAAVVDILDRDGAVNMDEREADWRREGWTPGRDAAAELAYRPADNATAGFAAGDAAPWPAETGSAEAGATLAAGAKPAADLMDADAATALVARSAAELVAAERESRAPLVPSPGAVADLIAPAGGTPPGGTPDRIYAAAAPGLDPAADVPRAASPQGKPQWPTLAPRPRRDSALSRPRVRSFVADAERSGEA